MQRSTTRDSNCDVKLPKFYQVIPKVMDGYCKRQKVPDDYRSKVQDRVTRNYNACIERKCIDHGLTRDKERRFTPKPNDLDYADKYHPETDEETEQHSTDDYLSFQSSDSINSDDTSTKTINADNGAVNADNGAILNTGHGTEHIAKEASDNVNAIQNANISFNLV